MSGDPLELELELRPRSRYDAIDVTGRVADRFGDVLEAYPRVLYCSHHTTAGYLEQGLARRLQHCRERLDPFIQVFQRLFPYEAGYRHDDLDQRSELSDAQRLVEPPNADAHLTFIGSGLQSCVTYSHRPSVPVFFMDLDGVFEGRRRTRTTTVVGYRDEELVASRACEIPVSPHPIDSVNLWDERLGLQDRIQEVVGGESVRCGRLDITLDPTEVDAALTVNEYETLLMRHDVAEVLKDPLRFVARQGRRLLRDPRAVPIKSLGYAKYDMVQVLKEVIDALGLRESAVERLLARAMAFPASRILRLKRTVSLPVSCREDGSPRVVHGRYQSPILMQWGPSPRGARTLQLRLTRLH